MFDRTFLTVMTARPSLLPKTGSGQYGAKLYGPPVPFPAYIASGSSSSDENGGAGSSTTGTIYAAPPAYWDAPLGRLPDTDDAVLLPSGVQVDLAVVKVWSDQDEVVGLEMEYS